MIKAHKKPDQNVKLLASGVDSLYTFMECDNIIDLPGLIQELDKTLPGEMFAWHGLDFLRVNRYLKGFSCCCQWQQFQLFLNKSQIFVQFLSLSFELFGFMGAVEKLCQLLEKMRNAGDRYPWAEKLKVSRIDTFVDFAFNGEFELDNIKTKLRKRGYFESGENGEAKTLYYGSRANILIRLYVKSEEIKTSGKSYLKSSWAESGSENEKVWRFEAEYHKNKIIEIVHHRELINFNDETIKKLIAYQVDQFQAVQDNGDSNITRRPLHPVWELLQKEFDSPYQIERRAVGVADISYRWKRARPWLRSWLIAQGVEFDKIPETYRKDFKLDRVSYENEMKIYKKMME